MLVVHVHVLYVCVCQSCGRIGWANTGSYLCVTGRGTMQRIDAKPTATLQSFSAFYSPPSTKRQKMFLSLPFRLSLRFYCILWSVLLFKCSYSPFRRRATFKPTVTMATPICIWKVHLKGPTKCATTFLVIVLHLASTTKMGKWEIWGWTPWWWWVGWGSKWKRLMNCLFPFFLLFIKNSPTVFICGDLTIVLSDLWKLFFC